MGEARKVVERFYQQFGAGDMTEAFACFAAECIALTPSGALHNAQHEAVARLLKHAIADGHMDGSGPGGRRRDRWNRTVQGNPPKRSRNTAGNDGRLRPSAGPVLQRRLPGGERHDRRVEAVGDRLSIVAQLGASIGADVGHLPALLSSSMMGAGEPPGPQSGP
jgi:hypothetical protein